MAKSKPATATPTKAVAPVAAAPAKPAAPVAAKPAAPVAAKPAASAPAAPAPAPKLVAKAPAAAAIACSGGKADCGERQRMIAEAAYYIAEKRGFSPGNHDQDWAEAERQIDAILKKK